MEKERKNMNLCPHCVLFLFLTEWGLDYKFLDYCIICVVESLHSVKKGNCRSALAQKMHCPALIKFLY